MIPLELVGEGEGEEGVLGKELGELEMVTGSDRVESKLIPSIVRRAIKTYVPFGKGLVRNSQSVLLGVISMAPNKFGSPVFWN